MKQLPSTFFVYMDNIRFSHLGIHKYMTKYTIFREYNSVSYIHQLTLSKTIIRIKCLILCPKQKRLNSKSFRLTPLFGILFILSHRSRYTE